MTGRDAGCPGLLGTPSVPGSAVGKGSESGHTQAEILQSHMSSQEII